MDGAHSLRVDVRARRVDRLGNPDLRFHRAADLLDGGR
jgi:hypothetical protein